MENKIATLLGIVLFNTKKTISQCYDQTLGSTVETLVIQFDEENFEQLLFDGSSSPIAQAQEDIPGQNPSSQGLEAKGSLCEDLLWLHASLL